MSRYRVAFDNPHVQISVGWDPPLQTYFGQVCDDRMPEGEDNCVYWVGTTAQELPSTRALALAMRHFVELDEAMLRQLKRDQETSPPQTPLQQHMLAILRHVGSIPLVAATVLSLLLTGCAMPTYSWYRPGLTEAEWRRDSYDCERDARMSAMSFGATIVGQVQAERFAMRCMESKGYERVAQ